MPHYRRFVTWLIMLNGWCLAPGSLAQELQAPRPIAALDSVFLEELTWMEVRDAINAGKTTVIVGTGGVEPNGPYVALGKHNYVLQATTEAIARQLGNALVAPIIKFVPEGSIILLRVTCSTLARSVCGRRRLRPCSPMCAAASNNTASQILSSLGITAQTSAACAR